MAEFFAFNLKCPAGIRHAVIMADYDARPVWEKLQKPMLVIHGVEDRVVAPICGIEASELAENGDLILYENCGHAPFIEFPERFNSDLSQFTIFVTGAAA